ncbi:MAG: hypothetical protein GY854_19040 [Deltaproteobacteria bacterium]|nr:hypothetical protein [Deltaproteobacteria bacterium]
MAKERRRDERLPINLEILFKSATLKDFIEEHAKDIGRGGVFVKMMSPLPAETLIKFDLRLDQEGSLIQGIGRVAWIREEDKGEDAPAGMGVKFFKLDTASQRNLDAILENKSVSDSGPLGSAPEVTERPRSPSRPPHPITLARPQSAPKGAKSTMIGIGPWSDPQAVAAMTPQMIAEKRELDAARDKYLSDISKKTDDTQGGEKSDKDGFRRSEASTGDKATHDKPASTSKPPSRKDARTSPVEKRKSSTLAKREPPTSTAPAAIVNSKVGVEPEKQRNYAVVWILAVICTILFVWYFGLKSDPIQGPGAKTTTTPSSAPSWSASPGSQKASNPSKGVPESTDLTSFEVMTSPEGAQVFVGSQLRPGTTPLMVDKIPVGKEIEIKARLFGFLSQTEKIIPEEKQVHINMILKPAPLKLTFEGEPAGAAVKVSGKRWGTIPSTFTKERLEPELGYTVSKTGYETLKGTIASKDWSEKDGIFAVKVTVQLQKKQKGKSKTQKAPEAAVGKLKLPPKSPSELAAQKQESIAEPSEPAAEKKIEPVEEAPPPTVAEDKPIPKTETEEKEKVETNPEPSSPKASPSSSTVEDNPF